MIVWPEHLVLPSESPWSILNKLAWFNESTPAMLLAQFYGLPKCGVKEASIQRSLTEPDWLAHLTWQGRPGTEPQLQGAALGTALSLRSANHLIGEIDVCKKLRTCTCCMEFGYHSVLHQLAIFENCPVHKIILEQGCPCCGEATDYAVVTGASAYGCRACKGTADWDEDWSPRTNALFARYQEDAFAALRGWWPQVEELRIHMGDQPLMVCHNLTMTPANAEAWLAHQLKPCPPSLASPLLALEPYELSAHVYESFEGELLREAPAGSRAQQIEFALELQEEVEDIARAFVERARRRHPCLMTAHTDMWMHDRSGTPYVAARDKPCFVALAYYRWMRSAVLLAEQIGAYGAHDGKAMVGNLADLRRALVTELHRAIGVAWQQGSPIGKSGAIEGASSHEARRIPRLFWEWSRFGISEIPKPCQHVRPALDYGRIPSLVACTHSIPGRVRGRGARS